MPWNTMIGVGIFVVIPVVIISVVVYLMKKKNTKTSNS